MESPTLSISAFNLATSFAGFGSFSAYAALLPKILGPPTYLPPRGTFYIWQ